METGKPGCAPVHNNSTAAQTEKRMDIQAPLTAVYIHTMPALPVQPYPQLPAAAREPAILHLAMPPLYSKEMLPFLTLHIAGGLHSPPGLSVAASTPTARPKSAGKHLCPHCGRDCMKPSVLEKHLRCHTGERPYPCTICGVSFKTQSNLYKHKRTQAHARLSSESDQSSLGSLDSMYSSRETHSSSLSLDEHSEESGSREKDATIPVAEITCPANTTEVFSIKTQGSVCEKKDLTPAGQVPDPNESAKDERPKDIPAVLPSSQSTAAGFMDGDCLARCAAQKLQTRGPVGTPGQSDSMDWRPQLSQEAGETIHQRIDGQGGGGVMREDEARVIKRDQAPGQWGNTRSNCGYTVLSDMTKPEG
ncbi:putative zinc finger protein 831 [Scophthalmus maximus]|uniref:Putative zinc finger protein 831 n=1 Tax=Scophthalmus maximus TaxID=52904 RepID=A0A2U9BIW4_SCOMX|nr:putative zinc finger protein 831 [Scophthalmus maximus]